MGLLLLVWFSTLCLGREGEGEVLLLVGRGGDGGVDWAFSLVCAAASWFWREVTSCWRSSMILEVCNCDWISVGEELAVLVISPSWCGCGDACLTEEEG